MTDNGDAPAGPEPFERGRYSLFEAPGEQGMLIYRATGLCDRCAGCGCGEQQDVIPLTMRGVMALAAKQGKAGFLKSVIGRG